MTRVGFTAEDAEEHGGIQFKSDDRRIFASRLLVSDFQFQARGRTCIALASIPAAFGVCIDTLHKWARKGCPILNGERAIIWRQPVRGGHAHRSFTFKDLLERQKAAKLALPEVPPGYCTIKYAQRWKSRPWIRKAIKLNLIHHLENTYVLPHGQICHRTLVSIEDVKNPPLPEFPDLLRPSETGIHPATLKYLRKTGKLSAHKRHAIQIGTGKLVEQYLYLPGEIERERRRLQEKPGGRVHWIEGRDFYPFFESLRLGTDAKKPALTTLRLRKMMPREFGGFGQASEFFDPPRLIECRKVTARAYRSKHGENLSVLAGDDLRLIEQRLRGWSRPRAAPAPPATPQSDSVLNRRRGRPIKRDAHALHRALKAEWKARREGGTSLADFLREKRLTFKKWEAYRTCRGCRKAEKSLW